MVNDSGLGRANAEAMMRPARTYHEEVELPLTRVTNHLATCVTHDHHGTERHAMVSGIADRFVTDAREVGVYFSLLLVDLVHDLVVRDQVASDRDRMEFRAKRPR